MDRLVQLSIVAIAIVAGALAPRSAEARPYQGYGFLYGGSPSAQPYLGFSGVGTGVLSQAGGVEYMASGGGGSIWGGLRFGPLLAIELGYTGSFHNPAAACEAGSYYHVCSANYLLLDMVSADAKLHLPTQSNFDPYLQAGLVFGWVGREGFAPDAKGGGFDVGVGFDVWINPWWTVGVRGLYRGLRLSDHASDTGTGMFLSVVTAEVGLGVHF